MIAPKPAEGSAAGPPLEPSAALLAADGYDIVRKAKGGKKSGRYLIMMPGLIDLKGAGEVGSLEGIETAQPHLTVTLPDGAGRVRFQVKGEGWAGWGRVGWFSVRPRGPSPRAGRGNNMNPTPTPTAPCARCVALRCVA